MPAIYFIRRLAEILFPIGFLIGVFLDIEILWIVSGLLMAIEDILSMLSGELKPTFPIIAALVGGAIIKPWYLGVFWSIEIFAVLNIPTSLMTLFSKKMQETDKLNNEKEKS